MEACESLIALGSYGSDGTILSCPSAFWVQPSGAACSLLVQPSGPAFSCCLLVQPSGAAFWCQRCGAALWCTNLFHLCSSLVHYFVSPF